MPGKVCLHRRTLLLPHTNAKKELRDNLARFSLGKRKILHNQQFEITRFFIAASQNAVFLVIVFQPFYTSITSRWNADVHLIYAVYKSKPKAKATKHQTDAMPKLTQNKVNKQLATA